MPTRAAQRVGDWLPMALLLAIVAGFGLAQAVVLEPNGDASWYVYVAGRVLDGDRLYVDLVDTNPPLIVWLDMAVVAGARIVGRDGLSAFQAVDFGMIGVSLAMSWRLSRGQPEAIRKSSLVAWAFLLLVQVGGAFGQREHLLMIMTLPYAQGAAAVARGERIGTGWALVSGMLGGLGFALKPQFLVPVVLVEGFLAWRCGRAVWWRPQAWALLVVLLSYAVAVVGWTPEYFRLAVRFAPLYPHHRPTGTVLLSSSWRLLLVIPAVGVSWFLGRRWSPGWAGVFGSLTVGLTAVVYLTGKGWLYHWFPAEATSLALLIGSGALWLGDQSEDRRRAGLAGFAVVIVLASALSILDWSSRLRPDREAARLVRLYAGRGEGVLVLSCWVHTSFPLIQQAGATWSMRHPMLWQIAAFYDPHSWSPGRYHAPEVMSGPERRFVDEVVADFERSRPVLLLVHDDPPTPDLAGFGYLDYLAREPRFARCFEDYEYLTRSMLYRIYRRRGAVARRRPGDSGTLVRDRRLPSPISTKARPAGSHGFRLRAGTSPG